MERLNLTDSPGIYFKTYKPTLKYTVKWKIENYSEIPILKTEKSPEFSVEQQSVWYMELEKSEMSFVLNIHRNCDTLPVKVVYKLTVNDSADKECYMVRSERSVNCQKYSYNIATGSKYMWQDTMNLMSKAKDDTVIFTVFIKVDTGVTEFVTCTVANEELAAENLQHKLLKTLSDDLSKFLNSRTKPDLVLNVQNQKINVHQAILSARSPVFAKMFQKDCMNETKHNVVDIKDITMLVLSELVLFLYSGQMKDYNFQTALELYYAADKYEVLELREICAGILVSKMTLDDSVKMLSLAELHQDADLKDNVMEFIKTHYKPKKNSI